VSEILFEPYPKTPRLEKPIVVTEKIDGTNAQIYIRPEEGTYDPRYDSLIFNTEESGLGVGASLIRAGSRNRWISVDDDNYGFARWVADNAAELLQLGYGRHFGEWWGRGIQRGYDMTAKKFSLFNVNRWTELDLDKNGWVNVCPPCCDVVPVLAYEASITDIPEILEWFEKTGSLASPGFMQPEGLVAFHTGSQQVYKVIIDK
jgi:hypothetical protein